LKGAKKKEVREAQTLTFQATRVRDLMVIPVRDFRRITRALDQRGVVMIRTESERG
jgi:hypothetical protein